MEELVNVYFSQFKKYREIPYSRLKEMGEYIIKKYGEDSITVYEKLVYLLFGEGEVGDELALYTSIFERNTTIGQYREMVLKGISKLMDVLKEDGVWKEVNNYHITVYYSLYLKFLVKLYLKLYDMKLSDPNVRTADAKEKFVINAVNLAVVLLSIPLVMYLKDGKVFPYISELTGLLLYAMAEPPLPSTDSLGYYFFSRIHSDLRI